MFDQLPLTVSFGAFALAAVAILFAGLTMTGLADRLADRLNLGEAIAGGVLLGAATSLSGTFVSVTAAWDGNASLAFSNSVGGIAAQTAFLALADMIYRRANLEHAAAELANIFQALTLIGLLSLPLVALLTREWTLAGIHPISLVIPVAYAASVIGSRTVRQAPMWVEVSTPDTREDRPEQEARATRAVSTKVLLIQFLLLGLVMAATGWIIAKSASEITGRLALSASLVGALATAVVTSLPELVTTLAAIRRGALQLAMGGIIGGNTFDVLFLTAADIGYREGSIYHAATSADYSWIVAGILMNVVLLGGMILRERRGPARIGWETVVLLAIYCCAIALSGIGAY